MEDDGEGAVLAAERIVWQLLLVFFVSQGRIVGSIALDMAYWLYTNATLLCGGFTEQHALDEVCLWVVGVVFVLMVRGTCMHTPKHTPKHTHTSTTSLKKKKKRLLHHTGISNGYTRGQHNLLARHSPMCCPRVDQTRSTTPRPSHSMAAPAAGAVGRGCKPCWAAASS